MDLLPTTLRIGTTDYDDAARGAAGLVVDSWGWDLDGDLTCEFHEEGPNLASQTQPSYAPGTAVKLTVNVAGTDTPVFLGEISWRGHTFDDSGHSWAYRCRGAKYLVNKVYVTAADASGTISFNLPPNDFDNYVSSFAGQSVGQIFSYLLTQHSSQLAALGITTDATTTSQLAALTLVPNDPVRCSGRLGQAFDSVLRRWARNYAWFIGGDGKFRVVDTTAGTSLTLTEGVDLVAPFRFAEDLTDCSTRIVVRGGPKCYPFYARLSTGDLVAAWTGTQQANWTYSSYTQPAGAYDTGTVTTITGSNTVRIDPDDNTKTWAVNYWPARQAWLHLFNRVNTGLTFTDAAPMTANTALAAAGTSDVTLGYDLANSGAGAYTTYTIVGTAGTLAGGDLVDVWRLYDIADPYVKQHLLTRFPVDLPWLNYYGDGYSYVRHPAALIVLPGGATLPTTFKVVPQTGQIRFDNPVVSGFNSQLNLSLGGSHVQAPADIYVMLGYSRGALESVYPADVGGVPQYAGSAFTDFGYQKTDYIDLPEWVYQGDQSTVDQLAEMHWRARCDVVRSGTVPVLGARTDCFAPGVLVSIAGSGYTTGQESAAVPLRGFTLRYHPDGRGGVLYTSQLRCDSRRDTATGDRYFSHTRSLEQLRFKLPFTASLGLPPVAGVDPLAQIAGIVDSGGGAAQSYGAAAAAQESAAGAATGGYDATLALLQSWGAGQ